MFNFIQNYCPDTFVRMRLNLTWQAIQSAACFLNTHNQWSRHARWCICGISACPSLQLGQWHIQRGQDAGWHKPLKTKTERRDKQAMVQYHNRTRHKGFRTLPAFILKAQEEPLRHNLSSDPHAAYLHLSPPKCPGLGMHPYRVLIPQAESQRGSFTFWKTCVLVFPPTYFQESVPDLRTSPR